MMDIMSDFETRLAPPLLKSELYSSFLSEMKNHMKGIRNTNAFMLMSINRTMDYTKASRGLKLIPNMDTIDLLETLALPLNCMKNIQNRVNIQLLPIHSVICSFIVTDKQWLQENILCLLSNASKYSSGGDVTVKVSWKNSRHPYQDQQTRKSNDSLFSFRSEYRNNNNTNNNSLYNNTVMSDGVNSSPTPNHLGRKGFLLFEIEDNGIGMSEETMMTLFSPFKQAQRLAGGTGLGLYSLSKRIEALDGEYGVRGRKDGKPGCLFWFSFPYLPDHTMTMMNGNSSRENSPRGASRQQQHGSNNNRSKIPSRNDPGRRNSYSVERVSAHSPTNNNNINNNNMPVMLFQELSIKSMTSSDHSPRNNNNNNNTHNNNNNTSNNSNNNSFYKKSKRLAISKEKASGSSFKRNLLLSNELSLSILLVEDSPTIAKMTTMMLQRLGHRVTIAENGHLGLNMLIDAFEKSSKPFDVVLMDFQMPVMDGLEATRRYREYEKKKNTFHHQLIIGLSATFDKEIIAEAMNMGLDDYLMKPITKDLFLTKLEKFLSIVTTSVTSLSPQRRASSSNPPSFSKISEEENSNNYTTDSNNDFISAGGGMIGIAVTRNSPSVVSLTATVSMTISTRQLNT
jgi:CheY-like chemotaxis protein